MNPDLKTFTDGLEARTEEEAAMMSSFLRTGVYPINMFREDFNPSQAIRVTGSRSRRLEDVRSKEVKEKTRSKKAAEKKARKNQRARK